MAPGQHAHFRRKRVRSCESPPGQPRDGACRLAGQAAREVEHYRAEVAAQRASEEADSDADADAIARAVPDIVPVRTGVDAASH